MVSSLTPPNPSTGPLEPSVTPTDPNNGPLIGVSVALAVLITAAVGACVPVVVCVYFRSRRSRKHITEGYSVCITSCLHAVCKLQYSYIIMSCQCGLYIPVYGHFIGSH